MSDVQDNALKVYGQEGLGKLRLVARRLRSMEGENRDVVVSYLGEPLSEVLEQVADEIEASMVELPTDADGLPVGCGTRLHAREGDGAIDVWALRPGPPGRSLVLYWPDSGPGPETADPRDWTVAKHDSWAKIERDCDGDPALLDILARARALAEREDA